MRTFLINQNKEKVSKGLPQVKINVISFFLGGSESEATKSKAKKFMLAISEATNGTFRDLNDKSKLKKEL